MSATMSPSNPRILVVDTEPQIHRLVQVLLGETYRVEGARSAAEALLRLHERPFDVLLFEEELDEGARGLDFLKEVRKSLPDVVSILFSGHADVTTVVSAMRNGAYDVVRKTAAAGELRGAVDRACRHGNLTREIHRLRSEVERARGLGEVIGSSQPMRQLLALAERVASSDATVLILGESGTGKELLARTIHRLGPRADKPFVAFDCSALTPSLLEAELFGHEKGAFTGAGKARRGLFREAHGGTLLLDEIGDIAPSIQNKLLRVLQEREVKPVGGDQFVSIDVRVIAATNKDLKALVGRGEFREDLYWRLAVVPLQVPPLRERREDIPMLAGHVLARRRGAAKTFAGDESPYPTRISSDAMAVLTGYDWPGNVRELENVLSRAAILCDGETIHRRDLSLVGLETEERPRAQLGPADAASGRPLKVLVDETVRAVERQAIVDALERSGGSATRAAKLLGISRASIYNKLKTYEIDN